MGQPCRFCRLPLPPPRPADLGVAGSLCSCGTLAVGVCVTCWTSVCDHHSELVRVAQVDEQGRPESWADRRYCGSHASEARDQVTEINAAEADLALRHKRAIYEALLRKISSIPDRTERLLTALLFFEVHRPPTWPPSSVVPGEPHASFLDDMARVCGADWRSWNSAAIVAWFVRRCASVQISAPPGRVTTYEERKQRFGKGSAVQSQRRDGWVLPKGSDLVQPGTSKILDACVLADGQVIANISANGGPTVGSGLSAAGLVGLARVLGLRPPDDPEAF